VTYATSIHRRPQPRDWDLFDPPNSPYYDQSPNLFRGLSRFLGSPHTLPDAITIACIGIWWYGKTRQGTFSQPYRRTNIDTIRDAQSDLQVMDKYFVLSLENLRAGRYYTLLTSSLMHYQPGHLLANLVGILSFGPRIVDLYGVPAFIIIWVGSAVAGGLLEAYYWAKVENRYVIRKAVGASCSTMGLATVLACTRPEMMVPVWPIGIVLPIWLETVGYAIWSLLAFKHGWLPEVGHLGHFGGMAFGAFWWAVALQRKAFGHNSLAFPR
jgi:membrane associated rhomboid family serine protease